MDGVRWGVSNPGFSILRLRPRASVVKGEYRHLGRTPILARGAAPLTIRKTRRDAAAARSWAGGDSHGAFADRL
jgi:hypothetical protein